MIELEEHQIVWLERYGIEAVYLEKDGNNGVFRTLKGEKVTEWLSQDRVKQLSQEELEVTADLFGYPTVEDLRKQMI